MKNTSINKNQTKASDVIILAILGYLALQIHPIVEYIIVWTPLIDNLPLGNKLWTLILNVICIAAWFGIAVWLRHLSRTECSYDPIRRAKRPSAVRLSVAGAIAVAFCAYMIIFAGGFSFPYAIEGVLDVLYTAIYYLFVIANAAMFTLIITFGQKFGDLAFGESPVPYGGIVLGICMAATNLISGFSNMGADASVWMILLSAAIVLVYAVIYGVIFVITEKKPFYALPFIALMFIIL